MDEAPEPRTCLPRGAEAFDRKLEGWDECSVALAKRWASHRLGRVLWQSTVRH